MKSILTFAIILNYCFSYGQSGSIDTTFNYPMYNTYLNGDGPDDNVLCNAVQPDGKILIGGYFSSISGFPIYRLARLNPDGSLDNTFNPGNAFNTASNSNVSWIHLRTDGKMLVGGYTNFFNGSDFSSVLLLNSDGTIDQSFNILSTTNYATTYVVQPDGKLIIGGYVGQVTSGPYTRNMPCRINTDGTIDPTFDAGSGSNGLITSMTLLPDGKLACVGTFLSFNGQAASKIIRLNPDGSIDGSFNTITGVDNNVNAVTHQSDGKIIAAGSFTTINGFSQNAIVRLNIDGTIDNTFLSGTGFVGNIFNLKCLANDTILVAGSFTSYNGNFLAKNFIKLFPDGTIDLQSVNTFASNGTVLAICISPDNKILLGGQFSTVNNSRMPRHAKLNFDFTVVLDYNPDTGSSGELRDVLEDSNGKILIAGYFSRYNNINVVGICRLNQDGTLDTLFQSTSGIGNIYEMCLQPDGKILVGGSFNGNGTTVPQKLARLNEDGGIDLTFSLGTGFDNIVRTIAYQPDGKILVGGDFQNFNGTPVNRIIRLNQDGSIDNSLNTGNGFDAPVYKIEFSNDGKIYVGGSFVNYNGQMVNKVVRLLSNGSIDPTFQTGSGLDGSVTSIYETNSGDLFLTGYFTMYNDTVANKLLKLYPNGTIVPYFSTLLSTTGMVSNCIVQPDGKIIIGGSFYLGPSSIKLMRLNPDGTADTSFSMHQSLTGSISLDLQENGKVLTVGSFVNVSGWIAKRICRLNNDILGYSDLTIGFQNIQYPGCTNSGNVSVIGYNGVPPYTVNWSSLPNPTNLAQTIISPGTYSCTLTDAIGNTLTESVYLHGASSLSQPDLKVNLISGAFRPGFNTVLQLDALNEGCISSSGTVRLILDSLLELISSTPSPDYQNGDTLIYNFTNLIFNSQHFTPQLNVLTLNSAQIGDSICLKVEINPIFNDFDSTNNIREYNLPVINGYDPNKKSVYPEGKCDEKYIEEDQALSYTIQFQNTGNAEAVNIMIVDTLDSDLDPSTIRLIGQSHEVWMNVDNNVLTFHFDNIMLPDSTSNEPESHGYAIFEIKPFIGSTHGSLVSNKVEIYFDFNPPIVTNFVTNSLFIGNLDTLNCNPLASLPQQLSDANSNISVYPNPFNTELNVSITQDLLNKKLMLFSITGKMELESVLTSTHSTISISSLKPGIYFLCIGENKIKLIHF